MRVHTRAFTDGQRVNKPLEERVADSFGLLAEEVAKHVLSNWQGKAQHEEELRRLARQASKPVAETIVQYTKESIATTNRMEKSGQARLDVSTLAKIIEQRILAERNDDRTKALHAFLQKIAPNPQAAQTATRTFLEEFNVHRRSIHYHALGKQLFDEYYQNSNNPL